MRIFRLFFYASFLLMTSCRSSVENQLSKIDGLLNQYPDSALSALKQLDTSHLDMEKNRAYYHLLYSAALDKNYIDITDDSNISLAADYYANSKDSYNRMRSYYYQGIIRKNAGNYPAAIVSLEKAADEAKNINDLRYLGLSYRNMGSLFHTTNNNKEAITYKKAAISCFEKNKDSLFAQYAIYSLAVEFLNNSEGYLNNRDIDSCLLYARHLLSCTTSESLRHYTNLLYAQAHVIKGDSLRQAIDIFSNSPRLYFSIRDYGYCAYAFAKIGLLDSAQKWRDAAYGIAQTSTQKAVLNSMLFRIDSLEGNYLEALRKTTSAMAIQDSVTRVLLQQSLSVAQKNYFQQESSLRKIQMKRQRLVSFTVFLLLIILCLILFMLLSNEKKKQEAQLKEQMAQLAVYQQETRKGNGSLVGALFMERISRLFGLSIQYYEAGNDIEKSNSLSEFKKAAKELAETPAIFQELENNLNTYCSGIMDKLKDQVPGIKGNNRKIIALFFAGIPDPVVKILMQRVSVGSLRTLRSRFRQIIKDSSASDERLFLDMLEAEKQPGKNNRFSVFS